MSPFPFLSTVLNAVKLEVYTMDAVKVGEARFVDGEATVKVDGMPATYLYIVTYPDGREKDGMLHLFEVKNGPTAGLRGNQSVNIPKMMQFKPPFIPKGGNASYIKDFTVGQIYNGKYIVVYKKYF